MRRKRPALFRGRHFADEIIVLCVRWYLRYSLSYRDLAEMMRERNLSIDSSTIWRWVQRYAPELNVRVRRELKPTNGSWRTDEVPGGRARRTTPNQRPKMRAFPHRSGKGERAGRAVWRPIHPR